jgi:hypothetical protein
MEIKFD